MKFGLIGKDFCKFEVQEYVDMLISRKASVNARDNMGWTPLMYASESGFDGMVLQLLEAGAIVNAQNESL